VSSAIFTSLAEAQRANLQGWLAIITDFDLGLGPNGIEAAHVLRADRAPAPPVLVVTASSHSHVESAARAAGFDLLRKPASPAFLRRWLADKARVA
jgi:CheY-like chemotaxis protein